MVNAIEVIDRPCKVLCHNFDQRQDDIAVKLGTDDHIFLADVTFGISRIDDRFTHLYIINFSK